MDKILDKPINLFTIADAFVKSSPVIRSCVPNYKLRSAVSKIF
jgi:hypothetical protein